MVYEPRPAWSLEEVQGRFDHPVLESGVIRDYKRTPELEGHPQSARGGLIFSVCSRMRLICVVGTPSFSM